MSSDPSSRCVETFASVRARRRNSLALRRYSSSLLMALASRFAATDKTQRYRMRCRSFSHRGLTDWNSELQTATKCLDAGKAEGMAHDPEDRLAEQQVFCTICGKKMKLHRRVSAPAREVGLWPAK
jgi:hypothetical protein